MTRRPSGYGVPLTRLCGCGAKLTLSQMIHPITTKDGDKCICSDCFDVEMRWRADRAFRRRRVGC